MGLRNMVFQAAVLLIKIISTSSSDTFTGKCTKEQDDRFQRRHQLWAAVRTLWLGS